MKLLFCYFLLFLSFLFCLFRHFLLGEFPIDFWSLFHSLSWYLNQECCCCTKYQSIIMCEFGRACNWRTIHKNKFAAFFGKWSNFYYSFFICNNCMIRLYTHCIDNNLGSWISIGSANMCFFLIE